MHQEGLERESGRGLVSTEPITDVDRSDKNWPQFYNPTGGQMDWL